MPDRKVDYDVDKKTKEIKCRECQPSRPMHPPYVHLLTFGSATAVITTGSPPVGRNDVMGPPVEFSPGPGDRLFAITLETDGVFYIAGRSSIIEQRIGPRSPVPNVLAGLDGSIGWSARLGITRQDMWAHDRG